MEKNIPNVIIVTTKDGKTQKLTGEQYEMISEAVVNAMMQVRKEYEEEDKRTKKPAIRMIVDDKASYLIDTCSPKDFSYVYSALVALFSGGEKTIKDITESILEQRLGRKIV